MDTSPREGRIRGGKDITDAVQALRSAPGGPAYGVGEGLAATEGLGTAEALPDAAALGAAEALAKGSGVGDGKRVLGTFAKARANIRKTMTSTITTHGRARLSLRGGSAPRYPGWSVMPLPSRGPPVRRAGEG
jgi:hypothetical protein